MNDVLVSVWPEVVPVKLNVRQERSGHGFRVEAESVPLARELTVRVRNALAETDLDIASGTVLEVTGTAGCGAIDLAAAIQMLPFAVRRGRRPTRYQLPPDALERIDPSRAYVGELGLGGMNSPVLPVRGVISILEQYAAQGSKEAIVASGNAHEASLVPGITARVARSFSEVLRYLEGELDLPVAQPGTVPRREKHDEALFCAEEQRIARAAASGSHVVLVGANPRRDIAGAACRLAASLMAEPSPEEQFAIARTYSATGLGFFQGRPLRYPHWSISERGLVGGKSPGELVLAQHGLLMLEPLDEFARRCVDAVLRADLSAVTVMAEVKPGSRYLEPLTQALERTGKPVLVEHLA